MNFNDYIDLVNEGVYDPAVLKAIFMAGGPGAGKSEIAGRITGSWIRELSANTGALGFKVLNSDQVFEYLLTKRGYGAEFVQTKLPGTRSVQTIHAMSTRPAVPGAHAGVKMDIEKIPFNLREPLRTQAKQAIATRFNFDTGEGVWSNVGRLGLIIDATSDNYDKIKKQRERLRILGYDTMIVYVKTTLETSQRRNAMRGRSVPRDVVTDIWKNVRKMGGEDIDGNQQVVNKYKEIFGPSNYFEINNDLEIPAEQDKASAKLYVQMEKFARKPVSNPIGQKWIKDQLQMRRR